MVKQVKSDEEFKAEIKNAGDRLVLVDFFATWCGPCVRIAPFIDSLAAEFPDVVFIKVDVDECEDTAGEEGISAMPTFNFYHKGKKVNSMLGADEDGLKKMVSDTKASL